MRGTAQRSRPAKVCLELRILDAAPLEHLNAFKIPTGRNTRDTDQDSRRESPNCYHEARIYHHTGGRIFPNTHTG